MERNWGESVSVIYLCGPINGRSNAEAKTWRSFVKKNWLGQCVDPMRRDYRGKELDPGVAASIVAGDLADIDECDVVLAFFDGGSFVGSSMEIFYAKHVLHKPVVVVNASGKPLSPWLIYHADDVTKHLSTGMAVAYSLANKNTVV